MSIIFRVFLSIVVLKGGDLFLVVNTIMCHPDPLRTNTLILPGLCWPKAHGELTGNCPQLKSFLAQSQCLANVGMNGPGSLPMGEQP